MAQRRSGKARFRVAPVANGLVLIGIVLTGAEAAGQTVPPAGDVFASSGRSCGYPNARVDMSKIYDAAKTYPNPTLHLLTPREKQAMQERLAEANRAGAQPMREMAPCFTCSQEYEACIVFDRGGTPRGDRFDSSGPPAPPGGDDFGSTNRGTPPRRGRPGGSPPGGPDGGRPGDRPNSPTTVADCLDDNVMDADNPAASPDLRYGMGFTQAIRHCLADQARLDNLILATLAARFKEVAALLIISASPGAIDAILHPPGVSPNPNPYLRGQEEATRLCDWGLKVSPVLALRCVAKAPPRRTPARPPARRTPARPAPPTLTQLLTNLRWLRDINTTANRFNCGNIVLAVDFVLSRRGPSLPAPPQCSAGTPASQIESLTGGSFGQFGAAAPVNNAIYHAGDGARGIVFAHKPGANLGHFFNIVNHAGDVMLLDGQLGRAMSWAEYEAAGFTHFSLLRTN